MSKGKGTTSWVYSKLWSCFYTCFYGKGVICKSKVIICYEIKSLKGIALSIFNGSFRKRSTSELSFFEPKSIFLSFLDILMSRMISFKEIGALDIGVESYELAHRAEIEIMLERWQFKGFLWLCHIDNFNCCYSNHKFNCSFLYFMFLLERTECKLSAFLFFIVLYTKFEYSLSFCTFDYIYCHYPLKRLYWLWNP